MEQTVQDILRFVRENDVKFIRLAFCDLFGVLKNISILAEALPAALKRGVAFDASSVSGFACEKASDLFLHPDPVTLSILPWRPQQGRVVRMFCDIAYPDGAPFEGDARALLKRSMEHVRAQGYGCRIGPECEFYLFHTDEAGQPTHIPHDRGGYLDVAPLDQGENVRREICLSLEQMGFHPESSHHEQGPGQNEIDFAYSDPLTAADHVVAFRSVVKAIAWRNGLYASFMPKPLEQSGSGLHINISLTRQGKNLFRAQEEGHCPQAEQFIAGVLHRAPEMTAFLNPTTNSYRRLGTFEAPTYVTWSHQNRSQLVRIPAAQGEKVRMELRSADPSCNPYLAFAVLLQAGMEGIARQRPLCPPTDRNLFTADPQSCRGLTRLPDSLEQALTLAGQSAWVRKVVPPTLLQAFLEQKWEECHAYSAAEDAHQWEDVHYFWQL